MTRRRRLDPPSPPKHAWRRGRRKLSSSDERLFDVANVPAAQLTAAQLATRAVLRKGKEARRSLEAFFGFVMRHELTGELLVPAPHQKVMFSFIDAHPKCVIRLPVGCSKTFVSAAWALRHLGEDMTSRGAFVSGSAFQAEKPLGMVKDYMTADLLSARLSIVYPHLKPSERPDDPWTQSEITVDRPPGIRDPSIVARGYEAKIGGARLRWESIDDIVDDENSSTKDACLKTNARIHGRHLSRLDPEGSEALVCNTPMSRHDLTYQLEEEAGWPTLSMSIEGDIWFSNANAEWTAVAERDYLRPAITPHRYRLKAHDPDPDDEVPLWPARYSAERVRELRRTTLPFEYARNYLCEPFDETAARCKREWIERCKRAGIGQKLVATYEGTNPTFTGIDLGIGERRHHGKTVFVTYELLTEDANRRRILDVEGGRFTGKQIVDKLIQKHDAYHSAVAVENVQGQDFLKQWAHEERVDLDLKRHTTNKANKRSLDFGVESLFTEFQNGAWIIPCEPDGRCHPEVQNLIDDMLYYQPPPAHTGDYLMSLWIARERGRRGSRGDPKPQTRGRLQMASTGTF